MSDDQAMMIPPPRPLSRKEQLAQSLDLAVEQLSDRDTQALLVGGDLGVLAPAVRMAYYAYRCKQLDLDPMTRPFDLISLQGKTVMYANRACADQLRAKRGISVVDYKVEQTPEMLTIWVTGKDKDGRTEMNCASVSLGLVTAPEARANAVMKCMTKALRRLTLAMTGAGLLDETEVESVRGRREIPVFEQSNPPQGDIKEQE